MAIGPELFSTPPVAPAPERDYFRYSHGTQQQPGSQEGKYLGELGDIFKEGIKTGDELLGRHVTNITMEKGDTIMDEEMAKYEPIYRKLNNIPEDKAVDKDAMKSSLMTTIRNAPDSPNPPEMENGMKTATNFQEMSNKANNTFDATYAKMRVREAAKALRSTFTGPEQRKRIDAALEHSTGMAGANEAYNAILANINSYITKAQQEKNKEETHAYSWADQGLITATELAEWKTGARTFDSLAIAMASRANVRHGMEDDNRKLQNNKLSYEEHQRIANQGLDRTLQSTVDLGGTDIAIRGGYKSMDELIERLNEIQAKGASAADSQERSKLLNVLQGSINEMRQKMTKDAKEYVAGEPSKYLGGKSVNDAIDAKLEPYKRMYESMSSGDYSVAGQIAKSISDTKQNIDQHIYDSKYGQLSYLIQKHNEMDKVAGERVRENLEALGMDTLFKPEAEYWMRRMGITPPGKPGDPPPVSTIDAIEGLRRKGAKSADVHEAILRHIESIVDTTNPSVIRNMAYAAYNPKNLGVISEFNKDALEYKNGQLSVKPGQVDVLQRMFAPDILAKIKGLGDEKLNDHVMRMAENAFGFGIMRNQIKDFQDANLENGDRIIWDDANHRYGLAIKGQPGVLTTIQDLRRGVVGRRTIHQDLTTIGEQRALFVLENINRGLRVIKNVHQLDPYYKPEDTTTYMMEVLQKNGVSFTEPLMPAGKGEETSTYMNVPKGLPEHLYQALLAPQLLKKKQEIQEREQRRKSQEMSK